MRSHYVLLGIESSTSSKSYKINAADNEGNLRQNYNNNRNLRWNGLGEINLLDELRRVSSGRKDQRFGMWAKKGIREVVDLYKDYLNIYS